MLTANVSKIKNSFLYLLLSPPTSIFEPKKVQYFQFQKSDILLFYGCSEIIRTRNFTIFTVYATISNYVREIDHFTLNLLRRSDT